MKHHPTPWKRQGFAIYDAENKLVSLIGRNAEDTRHLIVKSVNGMDRVLSILNEVGATICYEKLFEDKYSHLHAEINEALDELL